MIKYSIDQANTPNTKFFSAKLVTMFAEPIETLNDKSLHPTHALVQDIDFRTLTKNKLRSRLFSNHIIGHKRTPIN